jgi:hypothetical protein
LRYHFALAAGIALALAGPTASAGERSDRPANRTLMSRPADVPVVTHEQRTLLAEKLAHADRLMRAATAGREVSADHRMWLMETMYRMPTAQLRAVGVHATPEATIAAISKAAKTPLKLGQASTELVYYPITPCRYIDTRNVGGPLSGTRAFDLAQTGTTYGGSAACDPKAAVGGNDDTIGALAMNVAIVAPTAAPGFIGVRPAGSTTTTALVNWYLSGAAVQASNAGVVTIDQSGATNEIEFFGSPTQFIVDVFGVFAAPTATALDCTNGTETSVQVNTTNRNFNLFANSCPATYAMVSNSCQTTAPQQDITLAGGGVFVGDSNCFGYYSGATAAPAFELVFNAPWCCRVPGR